MIAVQLRTHPDQPDLGAEVLLDWFEDKSASTVQYGPDFLKALAPSPVAMDLFRLAAAIFCADKIVSRGETADFWTREIGIAVPVSDPTLWDGAKELLGEALSFLSGDRWHLTFGADTVEAPEVEAIDSEFSAVSLFSGGLDSLAGVIELLELGERLTVVGHHDASLTDNKQVELFRALREHFGADRIARRSLLLRPAAPNALQARPLTPGKGENSTRSRSFLFIAAGVVVADALGSTVPLFIPENGFIGVNVPLTPARAGSLSTRTTHPLFIHLMKRVLGHLGLDHAIENPYRLQTKGEVLAASPAPELLSSLAPRTISCSHPEAPRWRKRPQGNCGYCYPCLIRRAAMHRVEQDRSDDYAWDALLDSELLGRGSKSGGSLRALAQSLARRESPSDVLMNGRIPNGEAPAFYAMYRRGRTELRDWLLSGASPELRRRLGAS
jgi:7-cyano-7-deazaguanine synthase in queuosine biosynthesis